MNDTAHRQLLRDAVSLTPRIIRRLALSAEPAEASADLLKEMSDLQDRICDRMPRHDDAVPFWETVWRRTNRLRNQWRRVEEVARRAGKDTMESLRPALDARRRELYEWTRDFIERHAPLSPDEAHFELGLPGDWPHRRAHHQRLEGLYQSVKRTGELPDVEQDAHFPGDEPVFALLYGGGWSVSAYSVLREAARHDGLRALVAFDGPSDELYGRQNDHTVRLAPAGLLRRQDGGYVLSTFDRPPVIHFACPHGWTGPRPHELGIPVLRSDFTLKVTDEKTTTGRALRWYAGRIDTDLPIISESALEPPPLPADLDDVRCAADEALGSLEEEGVDEVVVKPSRGWEARRVRKFSLSRDRSEALEHAVQLALECGAVLQELIPVEGGGHFNWRVFVALDPDGSPVPVGRFARKGMGDDVEMVKDREMLDQCAADRDADEFFRRLDSVAVRAFRAVSAYTGRLHPHFTGGPLGRGSYNVPYFLGVDLVGDARIMEVNGNEVAGLWTHDRLYPEQRGRTSRTVLESAKEAARAYRDALEED